MRSCARAGARIGSAWTKRIRVMARRSVVGGKSDRATAKRRRSSDVIGRIRIPSLRREDFKSRLFRSKLIGTRRGLKGLTPAELIGVESEFFDTSSAVRWSVERARPVKKFRFGPYAVCRSLELCSRGP